ncbi:MAG TPA: PAS domain S-box protein, partial [Catenuloplanes sp.]
MTADAGATSTHDELSDPFYRRAFGAMGQAVVVTDLESRVRYWNPAAEQRYGYTAAEALGRHLAPMIVPAADLPLA